MDVALGLIALVSVVCAGSALGRKINVSVPLLLVLAGVIGSFLPFVPDIELNPELVLVGLLPPLLYAAALQTSLFDFGSNRRAIGLLSVGYVIFGTLAVGFVVWWLFPEIPLAAAIALGAVVAPPDAVAATAIARKVGMPRRIVTILEGESLVNDATALVCLRAAIAAIAGTVSAAQVAGGFLLAAGGGLVAGLAAAYVLTQVRKRTRNVAINTSISLMAPFVAYLPAEAIHASGVLSVVVAGLVMGTKSPSMPNGAARLSQRSNWHTAQFLLENSVFLLIGLQVRTIIDGVQGDSLGASRIWAGCAVILLAVLLLRPVWVFPVTYLPRLIPAIRRKDPSPPWQHAAIVSWAGMRGVVTLAAVLVLPADLEHRSVLVLAAMVVVGGTLALQGFTLPALVRLLGVQGPDQREDALNQASLMQLATAAGVERLAEIGTENDPPEVMAMLKRRTQERGLAAWERLGRPSAETATPSQRYAHLRLAMLDAERTKVLELRRGGAYPHEVLSSVLDRLDVEESMLDAAAEDLDLSSGGGEGVAQPGGVCDHLASAPDAGAPRNPFCAECVREGTTPVHLRMCLSCGAVGCCDSSPGTHASRHYTATGHPVMRSIEPGEDWRWCYEDDLLG
ncbi:Na+/H+ antiporter [Arthrobacter sp. AL08]|uniref:Na+/H+ antiporter n=1 Tax=unclassified Arthrobacter TaxID=235627 RepID=UPI001D0010A5|nr:MULTISPECIES: Na+/H+ antiporter [unclassified Arthrobacter]MCB5282825.1 Sodium, potassium, lithium and rubidium/H(+) antiporter [Arthrobacter sp. ES1]MDI3240193.1 Na+/H+ antiporter [Arthrobacter sp. AL05]MDI3276203.1 Na+/H+ antiporter [Arthrobacter sp. AL08]WGZ78992.1 Na+/H+ antiporter [Arthrobacter sp. EM1]